MLERTETRFGIKPASLTADSAYGSADSLAWLVKQKTTTPHIPVFDKSNQTDGRFSPRRLCLRRRTRPLHLPGGQRASLILANLRDPQKRRHSRGDTDLSRQQIGLRRPQTQSEVLSECSRPRDPAGSARRCSRRSPCARRNTWRPVAGGRKSRCCSHISSESFASRACA